ncbi:Transcription-associated protein [Schistosoma japonicum]|uniref:Transcription-associated protein n=2 Tax=Schistosoma japonicum TaxID=6182 RepID=A0A4Z2CYG0_SCHJA|nr:Transcription-associated protein [Schistosoma japonicum]
MRSDSICAKISAKLDEIFCETTDLEEQIRAGHEICGYLENAASEREMQDLTFIIHDKIQYYLMSTRPENLLESDTQQLRHMCLEIIQKIPNGDHLRPFSRSLLEMLFKLVEIENEDNVLVCVKLIIDIHKFYRPSFSNDVSRFLDFVKDVYRDLKFRAYKIFEPKLKLEVPAISDIDLEAEVLNTFTVTSVYTQEPKSDGSFMVYHILPKSGFSLKVMQEIPILVVLMYQLFKQHIHQDISDFIPLIMDFINLKPTEEQKRNSNFSQEVFIDFMAAQVKTLSFLAYVIKIYQDSVELHSVSLVQGMMNLLINCPPSVTNMRKEFFIAARHILSAQEIRPKFLQVLDELMNEEILIGQGYTIRDALRPLAYSTLADLTHHIRSSLSLSKIARAIDVYGRNMHDHTLPFSIQQMSLRLILNLVECIRQRAVSATSANQGVSAANTEDRNNEVFSGTARRLLLQTLRLCVLKAKVVADHYIPALESTCISEPSEEVTSGSTKQRLRSIHAYLFANISSFSSELNEVGSFTDKNVPASDFTNILNSGTDLSKVHGPRIVEPLAKLQLSYTDVRTLVKALITGIRTVVTSMIQCPHDNTSQTNGATSLSATPSKQSISNRILSPDELIVLTEYFSFGMRMIDIVQFVNRDNRLYLRSQPSTKSPDERLLIETFALTFAQLNPISFHEIFSYKIHDYVVWCSRSPSYTNIALHLLSQPNKTSYFGYILLSYLVDRLERLGDGTNESALYMRLLKLCFSSVNMSGTENELVMKLHLRRIVQGSMHYCLTAKEPTAYLTLLRTLFRSIGGGAHDKLYREFFPLLPEMLTTLNRLLRSPHRSNARDLLGELCVIVPVRLSTLLPYLSLLMEPLVYVLNCNTVNQGLRTLELCVDNMQPDFLHDHLYQVRGDMLLALYNSLHSPSEYVQKMAFKVLGKLGLFNRTNLLETQRLRISSTEGEVGPQLRFHLNEFRNQPIDISVRCLVDAAVEVLQDSSSDGPSKLRSWEFLQSVCVAALNLNHSHHLTIGVEDFYNCFLGDTKLNNMILKYVDDICVTVYSENLGVQLNRSSCCMADDLCNHVMIMTVAGLLLAGLSKELYDAHGDFIAFLVRYATFLSIMQQFNPHLSAAFELRRLCKVDTMTTVSSDIIGSLKAPSDDHLRELDLFSISQDPDTVTPTVNEPQTSTLESHLNSSSLRLNPNLIIDSIMFVMGHEAKQLTQHMCILLEVIHNTAFTILSAVTTASRENNGDKFTTENIKKAVANLQIFQHIGHVIVDMLYHSAWYVKWGACAAILCLARFIHPSWFCSNLINLLRGLLYCIHSLSNQMNQGALMMARDCARIIITTVIISLKDSNDTNHSTNTTIIEDEDGKSMKSTPMLTRKRSSTTSQRRTVQVRRGRSANNPTVESSTNETSIKVGDEPMEVDNHDNEKCSTSSNFSPSLSPLLDAVIGELLDSLLSETDSVRTEARCLLRLIGLILGQPLCKLLASQWYQRIGHVLPPKQPCRLSDLPISTQLAVLEANYFFGQSEKPKVISKVLDSSKPFDFDIDDNDNGVGLLRYDLSKRDDCIFLSDVRSLLTQFEMTSDSTATTNNNSTASNTTAVSSNANNNSTVNSDQDKTQLNGTYSHSKFTLSNSKAVIPLSSNCMRLINLRVVACQVLSVTWYLDTQKARNLTALFKGMSCKNEYIHEAAFSCLKEFISKTSIDIELRHANIKQIVQNIRQNSIRCIHTVRQLSYCAQLFPSTLSERLCDAIYSHLNTSLESVINKQNPASISAFTSSNLELCTLLLDLFHLIPLATSKYVSLLLECVVNAERSLNIEPTSCLRLPLTRFLSRYPAETCALLLTGSRWPYDSHANRIFLFALGCSQGQPIVDYLRTNYHILMDLIQPDEISDQKSTDNGSGQLCLPQVGTLLTFACPRHLAIRAVHTIHQILPNWLTASNLSSIDTSKCNSKLKSNHFSVWETKYHPLFSSLVAYWQSNLFVRRQSNLTLITLTKDAIESQILDKYMTDIGGKTESVSSNLSSKINVPTRAKPTISVAMENLPCDPGSLIYSGTADHTQWDEPRLLLDCLLDCFRSHPDDFDLLFVITIGVTRLRYVADLYPLRCLLVQLISESDLTWHRRLFLHFIAIVKSRLNFIHTNNSPEFSPIAFGMNNTITTEDMYKLLAHLILPCLSNALERGENEIFLGGPAKPFEMNDSDLVHLFVSVLLEDPAVQTCTELRVMYYQMASLFVYHTPDYVHMGSDSEQGYRLRKFTDFARPCLTSSLTAVDLQEKYTGLQLLSHLIAKFNVLRTATVQVFQCLAKGAHTETKKIVNPALDILIPAWVQGSEDQKALALATKKIMLEDHGIQSCVHILGIIVRHSDFYYPIRHQILPHIIVIISRLSVQQLPVEQRRLALDMIYTAAQWDVRCRREITENNSKINAGQSNLMDTDYDNLLSAENIDIQSTTTTQPANSPMDKPQRDQLVNLLIRFACQAIDASQSGSLSEQSISRTLAQLEFAVRSDVWGGETCELRLAFIDRYFTPDDSSHSTSSTPSNGVPTASLNSHGIHISGASGTTPASAPSGPHTNTSVASSTLGATQATSLLMTLEVLRVLFSTLESSTLLVNVKYFSAGLCNVLTRQLTNVRLIRSCAGLLRALLERYPAEASHRQKITAYSELFDIYSAALKAIQDSFTMFSENVSKTTLLTRLQSAFLLFTSTQVQSNPHAFVDRCIVQLVKLVSRLIQDLVTSNCNSSNAQESGTSAQLTDLLIMGLEMIKSRLNVVSHEMRKTVFGPDLCLIMDRARDPRLFCAVLQVLRDWINVPKSEEHFAPTAREKVNFFCRLWQAYPRWIDNSPDVAKEILECIYDVYASTSVFRNHDLYVKLEQAFCCGLISPFPDITERFIALYLEASQLRYPANSYLRRVDTNIVNNVSNSNSENIGLSADPTDSCSDKEFSSSVDQLITSSNCSCASLLVRLLFLIVSNTWDEAHFRDGFWLSVFLDVLLCDVDTTASPMLSVNSQSFDNIFNYFSKLPAPVSEMSTDDSNHQQINAQRVCDSVQLNEFKGFIESQIKGLHELSKLSIGPGLRGMLCLAHKRPALASHIFHQLWRQIWDRLLLQQSETQCSLLDVISGETSEVNSLAQEHSNAFQPVLVHDSLQSGCLESTILSDSPSVNGRNLSPNEVRGFVIPQLVRFLTSDQHVHPSEPQPSSLGAFFNALASCADTLLIHLPLPAIAYLGQAHNQWYTVVLFLESMCLQASKFNELCVLNDLVYSIDLPSTEQADTLSNIKPYEFPFGAATLSLIALYNDMNDRDFLTFAWWHRLSSHQQQQKSSSENVNDPVRSSSLLMCLELAQHGYLLRSLDYAMENLSVNQVLSTPSSLESSSGVGSSASSNRAAAAVAASSSNSSATRSNVLTDRSVHLGELINRARLRDYCVLQLKQLGQWEALDSLASSFQSASLFGPGSMSAGNANSTGVSLGNSGGSSYWGLKADAAWRRSDWSEVYYDLARLANECPHNELPRYALIQAAACVAGRRAAGFTTVTNSNTDIDSYNPGITSGDLSTGSTSGPNSSVSNNASSTNITSTPPHSNTTSMSPMNNIVNMIHASEQESHRVVSVTLMEWRRLPLIVTTQHVPLLQIAHRAVEITEGNSLLAQYCGHVLSGSSLTSGVSNSTYSSPSQTSSGSSTPVPQSNSISASSGTSVNMRLPFNQALHDYKTVFKAWQSRPCSIGDDLGFWHDLFSWRQVVEECIISCHPFLQKLKSENSNLLALCQRELALSQLQLARGARKCRFPSIAQQHLDRYARMNLPPLFEKTKQEIKLKLTDLRRDELLEGLELMEKTNIQQFEKKDRAKFFCYKAVFFSHFNKGDEATKNFGYATQMQDNLHKVWSIYGDFLENVYSNYPSAKREVAVSTTGIFAMQALMEAASVSGGIERKSRADIAKCLWLLTLDDVNGQQRLAHTFEARASRVRPEAFLPWLPDLVASLLRPEGRFIVPALRRVIASYPTILYGYLKGLQHQLATEVNNDQKLAEFIQNPENKNSPFVTAIQNRITSTLGSENNSVIKCGNLSWSLNRGNGVIETNNSNRRSGYNFASSTHQSFSLSSAPLSNASKIGSHNPNAVYSNTCAANASVSSNSNSLINSKKKKRVIVVMRGVEGERLNASPHSSSPPPPQQQQKHSDSIDQSTRLINNHPKKVVICVSDLDPATTNSETDQIDYLSEDAEMTELDEDTDMTDVDRDDEDEDFTGGNEDIPSCETDSNAKGLINDLEPKVLLSDIDDVASASVKMVTKQTGDIGGGYGSFVTGCLSNSVVHGLHYVNILINQLKRKHSARLYAVDLFINEVGGRLRPTWAEQFLCQLCSVLDYLQRLAYAHLHPGRLWNLKNLEIQTIPHWLATELEQIGRDCGMTRNMFWSSDITENTTSLHNSIKFDSSPLCGTTSNIFRKDDKEKLRSSQSKFSSKTSDCIKSEGDLDIPSEQDDLKSSNQQQKQSILSTNIPAFYEVNQIASEVLSTECEKDPFFMHLRAILSTEMSNLQNESILSLIQKLTRRWIPMVEQHVAKLPVRTHISNYGARRLLELPNIVSSVNNASLTLSSKTNVTSNAPQVYSVFPSMPTVPCLELPGESVLLQSSVSNLGSMVNSQNDCSQHIGGYINNIPLYLHVAEIMPHVERVRCSSGAFAPPARRIGIRASNGRLFFYDLPCTSTPPIMDLAIMQVDALNGAKCHEILNTISTNEPANLEHLTEKEFCPSAYISWREIGPLQFFQMINTILLGQPETAKRNISLFVPRRMEVGPNGLYLTQVGSSVSAANVSIASACPLPSANPVNNRRLTALARPPSIATNCSSTYVDENQSIHSSLVCEEAYKQYSWSLSFAESNLTSRNPNEDQLPIQGFSKSLKSRIRIPSPPPGPLPNLMTVQSTNLVNQSTVIGSAAMALEAVGRPSGLDAGCRCTCTTLFGILEKCNCTLFLNAKSKQKHKSDDVIQSIKSERLQQQEVKIKTKSSCGGIQDSGNLNLSVNPPTGCRNLVCLFYEYISQITNQTEITNQDLFKLFLDISSRIPQAPYVRDPLFSNLGTLGGDDIDQNVALKSFKDQLEFPRGKLLRHWAENQMLDAESYWLLRRSLAHNLGVYGLMERLFHLTPLHPSCLVIDPRSGHTEAHHVCFGLPGDNYLSGQSHSINTERGFNQAYFVSCFNQSMLIQKLDKYGKKQSSSSQLTPKIPADSSTTDSIGDEWLSHNRPVPFRLTPHLAGLVCLPGAPVKVGPFSASFTTAAQALQNAQYDHSLANLYRTFLRRDYILWHRGRQSSFYAYQLLMSEQNETIQQSLVETCPTLPCSSNENDSSTFNCCSSPILVPDLTNEQLINLITCTVDSMNSKLKVASDYSGTEPKSWKLIEEATKPANLVHVNPNLLPWL